MSATDAEERREGPRSRRPERGGDRSPPHAHHAAEPKAAAQAQAQAQPQPHRATAPVYAPLTPKGHPDGWPFGTARLRRRVKSEEATHHWVATSKRSPAVSYSPTGSPLQYHRRCES